MVVISALALAGAAPENAAPASPPTSASSKSSGGSNGSKSGVLMLVSFEKPVVAWPPVEDWHPHAAISPTFPGWLHFAIGLLLCLQQCSASQKMARHVFDLTYFAGSKSGLPEGKDPELDSEVAKKKDPFFKEVDKRT